MHVYNYTNFYKACILSAFLGIIIVGFSIILGKANLFLLLNTDLGKVGDFILNYATYLGDGIMWALFVVTIVIFKRKDLPITIACIIISTIIAHYIKGHLLIDNDRPFYALVNYRNQIHTVAGITINEGGSFPSGHTTQAFTMYFLLCLLIQKKWIVSIGFLAALLVGYTRVYQCQHFPIDIAGGIGVALITTFIGLYIQKIWSKKFFEKKERS